MCGFRKNKPLFMGARTARVGQFGVILAVASSPCDTGELGLDELKAGDFSLGFCRLLLGAGKAHDC